MANTGADKMYASTGTKSKMNAEAIVIEDAAITFTDVADIQTDKYGSTAPKPIDITPPYFAINFIIAYRGEKPY